VKGERVIKEWGEMRMRSMDMMQAVEACDIMGKIFMIGLGEKTVFIRL